MIFEMDSNRTAAAEVGLWIKKAMENFMAEKKVELGPRRAAKPDDAWAGEH